MPFVLLAVAVGLVYFGVKSFASMAPTGAADMSQNRTAFLAMLRMSEGTARYADPYSVFYGGVQFQDLSDHPVNTGELSPVATPWGTTTAAGAYQFEVGTWNGLGGVGKYGDFEAGAQDAAAIDLIAQRGALAKIDAGQFYSAIGLLGSTWASLPSSTSGQPATVISSLEASYKANGGVINEVSTFA